MSIRLALVLISGATLCAQSPSLASPAGEYLGNVNLNRFDATSIANPHGPYGSRYRATSVNNPYGRDGSRFSPSGASNPHAPSAMTPRVVAPTGEYLGDFSANPHSPNSVSNPHGAYGSPYSPKSINNPFGPYGSPYSPSGARNRFGIGSDSGIPALRVPAAPSPTIRRLR